MLLPALLLMAAALAPVQEEPAVQAEAPPTIVSIRVDGERRYTEEQIVSALGQTIGAPLDPKAIDIGLKKLWTSFHVQAEVTYREAEGGWELLVLVTELPSDREPRFIGNVEVKTKKLKEWALLESQTELFVHQAERVRQRILEGYARDGFYFAEVNIVKRGETEALPDVIFEIREGPKVRVKGVEIRGNRSMPDRRFLYFFKSGLSHLAKRKLNPPSAFSWFGSPFVAESLEADLVAMRTVYREHGWLDAVVELERLEFSPDRSGVVVRIAVDEGQRYAVSGLSIRGVEWEEPDDASDQRLADAELVVPEQELLALCELEAGAVYEQQSVDRDERALRERYGERGHMSHPSLPRRVNWQFLEPELVFDVDGHTVHVTYRIVQGRQLRIREILFAGSHHTRDRVLRRELSVFPGQIADLEEIDRSLARLQATSFFSDDLDRLEHRDPTYRFLEVPDDPGMVDLQFEVDEGRVVDFNVSGGVDSNDGVFGIVSLTMRNFDITDLPSSPWRTWSEVYHKEAFHGAGQLLVLEVAPGTELSRFRVRFREPDIFQTHLRPISLDVDLQKRLRLYDTHHEDRIEERLRLGRKFTHDLWGGIGFLNTDLDVSDLDSGGVPPSLVAQDQLGRHSYLGPTFDLTTRSLDNVYIPHEGYSIRLNAGLYGGDIDFAEGEVHGEWYFPAWEKEDGTRPGFYLGADGGVSEPYGDTDEIPYTERYFLGGSRTLRGFEFREVGPFDPASGFALGGETYAAGSLEFRYPLHSVVQPGTYQRLESLRGTVFLDWGVLDPQAMSIDPDELRASAGFGVGLAWPIPIILNFGFPVREGDGDGLQVFSFNLGI